MAFGLPSVATSILNTVNTVSLDATAVLSFIGINGAPHYGIYDSQGASEVLTGYTSVVGFGFQRDMSIPTHPIEQGGFASYNKVALPFGAKLRYTVNGDASGDQAIADFLTKIEKLTQDTNLYEVVTPEYSWPNVSITHHDHNRSSQNGYSMLTVDVWLQEVRQADAAQFSNSSTSANATNTQSPDGQATVQSGNVQTQAAPSAMPVGG